MLWLIAYIEKEVGGNRERERVRERERERSTMFQYKNVRAYFMFTWILILDMLWYIECNMYFSNTVIAQRDLYSSEILCSPMN